MSGSNTKLTDAVLVQQAREGNSTAIDELITRSLPYIRHKARQYAGAGLEQDDLVQEGLLGLLGAIRAYDLHQSAFGTFAAVCISNKILSAVKSAQSGKNLPMRDYMPLSHDEASSLVQGAAGEQPESHFIMQETQQELHRQIETILSIFERDVLRLYLRGYAYREISDALHSSPKAIDNALQRVRRKLKLV